MPEQGSEPPRGRGLLASLLAEIRRRRVDHVAGLYLMGALAVVAYGSDILGNLGAPPAVAKWLTLLLIGGFPVAVAGSWIYDLRVRRDAAEAAGLHSPPGARGGAILAGGVLVGMALLSLVAFLARDRNVPPPSSSTAVPGVAVLPVELEGGAEYAWMTRALQGWLTDALSRSRGVRMSSADVVLAYAGLPLDSLTRVLGADYLVAGRLHAGAADTRLSVQVLDGRGRLVGAAMTIAAGAPSRTTAEELTQRGAEHVLHALGAEVQAEAWRIGTSSEAAFTLLYQADGLLADAVRLVRRQADARAALALLDHADALLGRSSAADPDWMEPRLLGARVAHQRAYALRLCGAAAAEMAAAFDRGIALIDRVLEANPDEARALALRGVLQHRKAAYLQLEGEDRNGLLTLAQADLHAALQRDPAMAQAAAELGHVLWVRADFAGARIWAQRALDLDSYQRDAQAILNRLAMATFEVGEAAEALRLCHEAVQRFGGIADHGCVLEVLAFGSDVPADAADAWQHLEQVRRSAGIDPYMLAYYEAPLAAILARAGLPDSARRVLERVRAAHPQEFRQPDLLCIEAAVRFRLHQADSAATLLRGCAAGPRGSFNLERRFLKPYRALLAVEPPR